VDAAPLAPALQAASSAPWRWFALPPVSTSIPGATRTLPALGLPLLKGGALVRPHEQVAKHLRALGAAVRWFVGGAVVVNCAHGADRSVGQSHRLRRAVAICPSRAADAAASRDAIRPLSKNTGRPTVPLLRRHRLARWKLTFVKISREIEDDDHDVGRGSGCRSGFDPRAASSGMQPRDHEHNSHPSTCGCPPRGAACSNTT